MAQAREQAAPETDEVDVQAELSAEAEELDAEVDVAGSVQGVAGASAQREYERRRDKREQRVREKHPKLGGLLIIIDDPQSTKAWGKGAKGEQAVGAKLEQLAANGLEVLHDRRIPGTRANIDHIAVSTSGVHVIDPKRYKGKVQRRDVSRFFQDKDERLFVGGRDRSKLVEGVLWQMERVQSAIADALPGLEIPVTGTLCFVDAEWSLFQRPMTFSGVTVLWPKELMKVLEKPGDLSRDQVKQLAEILAAKFPPA